MNRRLTRWLLALYPRYWRDRYGPEVADLNEQLINAGETTRLRAGLGMIAGAAIERGRALAGSRQAVMASVLAAIIAVAGLAFGLSHTRPASQGASSVSLACAARLAAPRVYVQRKPGVWRVIEPAGVTVTLKPAQAPAAKLGRIAASLRVKARKAANQIKRKLAKNALRCGPAMYGFATAPFRLVIVPGPPRGGPVSVVLPPKARLAWRAAKAAASRP
jgi:hypothetical protein